MKGISFTDHERQPAVAHQVADTGMAVEDRAQQRQDRACLADRGAMDPQQPAGRARQPRHAATFAEPGGIFLALARAPRQQQTQRRRGEPAEQGEGRGQSAAGAAASAWAACMRA